MKILKRTVLFFVALVGIGFLGLEIHEHLQKPQRLAIRRLCSLLKSKEPLDLGVIDQILKEEGAKVLITNFRLPLKSRYDGNLASVDPKNLESLFILADTVHRESLSLDADHGMIVNVQCHTDQGVFRR